MITLKVFNSEIENNDGTLLEVYNISIYNRLTLLLGNSSAGKSYLANTMQSALAGLDPWKYECKDSFGNDIRVEVGTSVETIKDHCKNNKNTLVIIDEDIVNNLYTNNHINNILKYSNYYLIIDRTTKIKMDCNVNAVITFKTKIYKHHKIYETVPFLNIKSEYASIENIKDIKYMITEDTASGKDFWKLTLTKLKVLDFKFNGNGALKENIKRALTKTNKSIIIALDYDKGAIVMDQIINNSDIDKSRIRFIPLESFEEVICNSEFILSKFPDMRDKVINYKDYITSEYSSTGQYFSALLYREVKARPPILKNNKDTLKFYTKGAEYFKECFTKDCCSFNKEDCSLFLEENKKKAMLSNKFEGYKIFMEE